MCPLQKYKTAQRFDTGRISQEALWLKLLQRLLKIGERFAIKVIGREHPSPTTHIVLPERRLHERYNLQRCAF